MKKTGKLLVSAIWLMLTFVAIVGVTFAWLSENRTVQAEGMSVQAETVKNLLISNAENGTYEFSANSTITSVSTMTPVSTVESLTSGSPKFYTLTAESKANKVAFSSGELESDATLVEVTPITSNPASGSINGAVKYTFYVKVNGNEGDTLENLYASNIAITRAASASNQSNITKALRIAIVCGSRIFIYSMTGGESTYNGISAISNSGFTTAQVVASTTADSANILLDEVTLSPVAIDIYVWYEGQDINCTSSNSLKVEDLTIAVSFNASDPVGN